jgi:acetylornithine deacetylase/succinyl-diaminopimelate desuccinylase-like protein
VIDRDHLLRTLVELARVPTNVELGFDTLMEPDDPKLVHYVQHEMRPRLRDTGFGEILDAGRSSLVVRAGDGTSGRSLILQTYAVTQHHNLMDRPFEPVVRDGMVRAQGVSQNKCHQAVMLAVLKQLAGTRLRGRLYWTVNGEGRSSHACTEAILAAIGEVPSFGVLQTPQKMGISLGNRGRVDVDVRVLGRPAHSSMPEAGLSAIEGVAEVVRRVGTLRWDGGHPVLGGRHAVVYKVDFEPKAPHTLPGEARLTVDRRLLPGDDPVAAADEIRAAIGDLSPYGVEVSPGVLMLPALVDRSEPGVRALQRAVAAVRGEEAPEFHKAGTYDAGGLCAAGTPAVMFGAGTAGDWPLGEDVVPVADVEDEARILAELIHAQLSD